MVDEEGMFTELAGPELQGKLVMAEGNDTGEWERKEERGANTLCVCVCVCVCVCAEWLGQRCVCVCVCACVNCCLKCKSVPLGLCIVTILKRYICLYASAVT